MKFLLYRTTNLQAPEQACQLFYAQHPFKQAYLGWQS